MGQYVGVKFRTQGQVYFFSCQEDQVQPGDYVLVSTEEGPGLAMVVTARSCAPAELDIEEIKEIDRPATGEDFQWLKDNDQVGREAFEFCLQKVRELKLDMKLVDVEVRFDQSKIVFYFTAPSRIDFRELVKILVNEYRTRIELRQIGVRHEAQILGGIGNCGRVCCCHQFLRKFEPVTIKMAKEQQLFLNPAKISGACGRLLCCLNFERANYDDFKRKCPKIGKKYETSDGELKVLRANLFRDSLVVGDQNGQELEITLLEWAELMEKNDLGQNPQKQNEILEQSQQNNNKSATNTNTQQDNPPEKQESAPESNVEAGQVQAESTTKPGRKNRSKSNRKKKSRSRKKKKS